MLYFYVPDVDQFYKHAEDTHWGERICCLKDIDGYKWSFASQIKV